MNKLAYAAVIAIAGAIGTAAIAAENHSNHGVQTPAASAAAPQGHAGREHAAHGADPTMPGQDAFGAIQEIVRILEADPTTDWSKVNLAGLREHLIDMNDVVVKSNVAERPIDGGFEATITGQGRVRDAIKRMVGAQARQMDGHKGWRVHADEIADGIRLRASSPDAKEAAHLRGLGFIGLLASGGHHQPHHLAMAKGEFGHDHGMHGAHGGGTGIAQ